MRIMKIIVKSILYKRKPVLKNVIFEVPVFPERIYEQLRNRELKEFKVLARNDSDAIEEQNELGAFKYARLIFCIVK